MPSPCSGGLCVGGAKKLSNVQGSPSGHREICGRPACGRWGGTEKTTRFTPGLSPLICRYGFGHSCFSIVGPVVRRRITSGGQDFFVFFFFRGFRFRCQSRKLSPRKGERGYYSGENSRAGGGGRDPVFLTLLAGWCLSLGSPQLFHEVGGAGGRTLSPRCSLK